MTMPRTGWWFGLAAAVALLGACDASEADEASEAEIRGADENGFRLNGFRLNGFRLNGFRLNGFRLNGFVLTGAGGEAIELEEIRLTKGSKGKHNGKQVVASWLEGSELHVETDRGKVLSGGQLKGAEFVFEVHESDASVTKVVRIEKVLPLPPGEEVWQYALKIRVEDGPWEPLCLDHLGMPANAILLDGVWDPDTGDRVDLAPGQGMTFACRDAALAKCVEWGYPPWESVDGVSLADYHQTCTRASRADYCGDGVPHTHDGVLIHVLDELGIQPDAEDDYVVEAEWGPDGAICLNPGNTRLPAPDLACDLPPCGAPFASGGLIQTGTPTDP